MVALTYFVHGTTTDNEAKLATGWLPGELSETGVAQSKALKDKIAEQTFDVIFCSDLTRAIQTAEIFFGKDVAIPDARLREANYGDWNGQPHTFKDSMNEFVSSPFPNGESYEDVEERLRDFLGFLRANYDDKRVAVVAHQAPQLALDVIVKGKTWPQAIAEDWRVTKAFQPGWEYIVK
ncbi:MAG TPA: histidine phosphatase family protein [Candidatus Saccharimonadales bacterium]